MLCASTKVHHVQELLCCEPRALWQRRGRSADLPHSSRAKVSFLYMAFCGCPHTESLIICGLYQVKSRPLIFGNSHMEGRYQLPCLEAFLTLQESLHVLTPKQAFLELLEPTLNVLPETLRKQGNPMPHTHMHVASSTSTFDNSLRFFLHQ